MQLRIILDCEISSTGWDETSLHSKGRLTVLMLFAGSSQDMLAASRSTGIRTSYNLNYNYCHQYATGTARITAQGVRGMFVKNAEHLGAFYCLASQQIAGA